jgi:hypothetical protein
MFFHFFPPSFGHNTNIYTVVGLVSFLLLTGLLVLINKHLVTVVYNSVSLNLWRSLFSSALEAGNNYSAKNSPDVIAVSAGSLIMKLCAM